MQFPRDFVGDIGFQIHIYNMKSNYDFSSLI